MTNRVDLTHSLTRTISIRASRDTVFRFFVDAERWAAWWGEGSSIDPRPGGRVLIRYPGGTEAVGEVIEIAAPDRLVFSYGYASGTPVPPSGSLVTIVLEEEERGTRVHLTHAFADADVARDHLQGWRYQLSLFANAVANDLHAAPADLADRWFAAWSEPEPASRDAALASLVSPAIRMRDQFSAIEGLPDLLEHVAAARRFMPGIRMVRTGDVRQCQGMAIAEWVARTPEGHDRASGTTVFELGADGTIEGVTGFWQSPRR